MSRGCGDCGQLGRTDVVLAKQFGRVPIITQVSSLAAGGKHVVLIADDSVINID